MQKCAGEKVKIRFLYSATHTKLEQHTLQSRKWQLIGILSQWCCSAPVAAASKHTTAPPQSTTPGFQCITIHQMAPLRTRQRTSDYCLLLIYRPQKDERLSWPGWLACSRQFTHISGHPSATGRAQDRKSSPAKD